MRRAGFANRQSYERFCGRSNIVQCTCTVYDVQCTCTVYMYMYSVHVQYIHVQYVHVSVGLCMYIWAICMYMYS